MPPMRSLHASTVRAFSSGTDTSACRPTAPVFRANASMSALLRPVNTTWCPACRACSTIAAPMPWLPPVTRKRAGCMNAIPPMPHHAGPRPVLREIELRPQDCTGVSSRCMDLVTHFQVLARYNRIANERLFAACAQLDDAAYRQSRAGSFGSIHGLLNHILLGDRRWLALFERGDRLTPPLDRILYDDFSS